ncbi:MAG: tRNA pseudouridine(13) synthase TruD [Candidatus ainarchaeum sp.]|nr:tRNA pseudouridine(13) synthase TruD [Candidatus ainarchaeum sp.]
MNYNLKPETFFVEEDYKPRLKEEGKYLYYVIEKKGLSHKQLIKRIPKDALFNGLKDKNATTKQWFCTKQTIENIFEKDLKIEYKGKSDEKIFIGKHKGNKFKILLELKEKELKKIKKINWKKELITNYFGKQRFDKRINKFNELLEKKDFENALKFFLTEKSDYDTQKSSEIKKEIFTNWNNWKKLIESNIPESKKPIFELLEKEKDFEKAFMLTEKKSLKQMLKAVQAKKWNELLHKQILFFVANNLEGKKASRNIKNKLILEGNDFEKKFGLNKLDRETYFKIKKFKIKKSNKKNNFWIEFYLKKGCYATIFIEYLEKILTAARN